MNNVCFIPAKGYSRRLKNKNILPINGIPMLVYSIRGAIDSGVFSNVIVTSDSDEILSLAKKEGASIIKRDKRLCEDHIRAKDVVIQHLLNLNDEFDFVALLMNSNPFRTANHINDAYSKLIESNRTSLVSLVKLDHSPALSLKIKNGYLKPYIGNKIEWVREDNYPDGYYMNGAIFICKYDLLIQHKTFIHTDTLPYIMDKESSLDINTEEDYKHALYCLEKIK